MPFDDYGISAGQRRSRVATRHREGQWKITGAKNDDRTQRTKQRANIRFGRGLAIRIGAINARHHPRSFFYNLREQAKLSAGARGLTLQAGLGQSGLQAGALDDFFRDGLNVRRNLAEKSSLLMAGYAAVSDRSLMRQSHSLVDLIRRCSEEIRIELGAGSRVMCAEGCSRM